MKIMIVNEPIIMLNNIQGMGLKSESKLIIQHKLIAKRKKIKPLSNNFGICALSDYLAQAIKTKIPTIAVIEVIDSARLESNSGLWAIIPTTYFLIPL